MLPEKYYTAAVEIGLKEQNIRCEIEKPFEVFYQGSRVGLYYVDVWVENGNLILENKVSPEINDLHRAQAISYLKVTDADLAFLVNFGGSSLEIARLPNFLRDRKAAFEWSPSLPSEGLMYQELTHSILEACNRVHYELGPGFLHQVYRRATMIELSQSRINYAYIKHLPVEYMGQFLGQEDVRVLIVEKKIMLVTAALRMTDQQTAVSRSMSLLKRMQLKLGFFANFHEAKLSMTPVRVK